MVAIRFSLSLGERAGVRAGVAFALLLILLLLFPFHVSASDTTAEFDAANRLYAEGKFMEAAGAYQKILEAGQASSAIYFNLGNAFFKSGQIGRAIAAYRQAQRISPRDPDVRANLQFARNQVQGPTMRTGRLERWLGTLSLNEWTWLSAVAVWLAFVLLVLRQLRPSLARPLKTWTFAVSGVALLLVIGFALAFAGSSSDKTAIVIVSEAAVRNSPFEESPNSFTARDGAELRVLDAKDDWLQVTDGTQRSGWVKGGAVLVTTGT
jgi:tetratricopeptide (TPR) repeat protein